VSLLYQNVLGRAPAQAEVNAWLANIAGGSSREDVVEGFAQSQEFITSTTASLKTWVRGQGWQDELDGGAGTNVLAGGILADRFIFDSTEDGTHTVLDLEAWDILVLENFSYTSAAEAKTFMTETGSDVVFADQGVTITLENTTLTQIADDMIQV
jgi:Ca2+-binding RTX toxin-like protein